MMSISGKLGALITPVERRFMRREGLQCGGEAEGGDSESSCEALLLSATFGDLAVPRSAMTGIAVAMGRSEPVSLAGPLGVSISV